MTLGHRGIDRLARGLNVLSSCSLVLALLVLARIPAASSYEISPYFSLPLEFYVFSLIAIIGATMSLLLILGRSYKAVWNAPASVTIVAIWSLAVYFVPVVRGYYAYTLGDSLTQMGYVRDILSTAHISSTDFYPSAHIFLVQLESITGLGILGAWRGIPAFVALLLALGIGIYARALVKSWGLVALSGIVALAPSTPPYFVPFDFTLAMVPFALGALLRSHTEHNVAWSMTSILLSLAIVFSHLLVGIVMLVMLVAFWLVSSFPRVGASALGEKRSRSRTLWTQAAIQGVAVISWFYSQALWSRSVQVMWYTLSGQGEDPLTVAASLIGRLSLSIPQIAQIGFLLYGKTILLALVAISLFLARIISVRRSRQFLWIATAFAVAMIFTFTSALVIDPGLGYERYLVIVAITAIPITCFGLYDWCSRGPRKKANEPFCGVWKRAAVCSLLTVIFVSSLFGTYQSPLVFKPNGQVTYGEWEGVQWVFLERRNDSTSLVLQSTYYWRFVDATYGVDGGGAHPDLSKYTGWITVPDHFGYAYSSTVGSLVCSPSYLLLANREVDAYTSIWSATHRYNVTDFERLANDPYVSTIFDSGSFQVSFVVPDLTPQSNGTKTCPG